MQLSKIKMSGFKSFVDPTLLPLPGKLIAVVGPNGCGKSNVIDAVTWVMGESSPKYLRGESLTDVIFNGSTARKPVGQAAVELVFDNTDGTIGGEFAKFAEISVKRVINRDSDSTYYLNGTRCRKRDIVDIFLGTGLGPRSYSIIGQNMISRLIEAKPDELRTYLEEAAGISKYKDRRHETELRIKHTNENLNRVNDVRSELEKQLNHLKQQANTAEKYKILKQQARVLKAELCSIQWRELDTLMVDQTLKMQRAETALEGRQSEMLRADKDSEHLRHEQRVAQDAFQEVQRRYYAVGNEITRIEQEIQHHQERKQQWETDLQRIESDHDAMKQLLQETEKSLQEREQDIQSLTPQVSAMHAEVNQLKSAYSEADDALQASQEQWDSFQSQSAQTAQAAQVEKTHIQHLEQRLAALEKRQTQIQNEQGQYQFAELTTEIEQKSHEVNEAEKNLSEKTQTLSDIRQEITRLQTALQCAHQELSTTRNEWQQLLGQQASLEALQQTALGQRDNSTAPWIKQHQLDAKPRLAQQIKVEKGWELAVEKALGLYLQAVCVENIETLAGHLPDFKSGNLCIFNAAQMQSNEVTGAYLQASSLISKIKTDLPLQGLLNGIYVAETLDEALNLSKSLSAHESVITRDGLWVSSLWLKLLREDNPAEGVFQREQALRELSDKLKEIEDKKTHVENTIESYKNDLHQLETQRDQQQQLFHQQQAKFAEVKAKHKMLQERLAQWKAQIEKYKLEQTDCRSQIEQVNVELEKARQLWQQALTAMEEHADIREEMIREREICRKHRQELHETINQKKEQLHAQEIALQTAKSQQNSLKQNSLQLHNQLAALNDRKIVLQGELSALPPVEVIKKSLSRALDQHACIESELNSSRAAVEALEQEFKNLEQSRQTIEREINRLRGSLETLRIEWQGWKVKADTLIEQIKETEFSLESILKDLPQEVSADEWQSKLDQTNNRINRLGPINLVAIDEYHTCLERKQYLDNQVNDLQAGLATLEEAINKIDKETRVKFKETFDSVNQRFQELFPAIFGGGKAYLELNSDNLLEAGVTLMACPPGKRNSSIYLLSGGEKSLTALALIFSIFYLNPAPFCLLDEVDAALDDANVLRFTKLVKMMAEKTQFIFISHNKISIEMGEHLIGVTMNEPGVSRLVSVDINKAMSMIDQ